LFVEFDFGSELLPLNIAFTPTTGGLEILLSLYHNKL